MSVLSELAPRITILTDEPVPPVELMVTPATLPDIEFNTFSLTTLVSSSPSTLAIEYPKDFSSLAIPNAVTTTSLNEVISSIISTSITERFPTVNSSELYPTYEKTKTEFSPSTSRL